MTIVRAMVILIGILLPYLARIPGAFIKGPDWFVAYLGDGFGAALFIGAFNAICWGSILASTFTYRHPRSVFFPALIGFALPAYYYSILDLSSSSTSAIGLIFIPIYSLPLVVIGWLLGLSYDKKQTRDQLQGQ